MAKSRPNENGNIAPLSIIAITDFNGWSDKIAHDA
jgi:hypothetical protein